MSIKLWGVNKGNVWHEKNGKRWSPSLMHRAAGGGWGLWALGLWCGGSHWGIHSSLHHGSQCFTHVMHGNHARIGSCGDCTREVAWVSWAYFRLITGRAILFFVLGIDDEPDEWASNGGVSIRGMSDMRRMGRGGVPVWCTGLLVEAPPRRWCPPLQPSWLTGPHVSWPFQSVSPHIS